MEKPRNLLIYVFIALLIGCSEGPEDAPEYYARATELYEREQYDLASVEVKNALRLNPDYLDALLLQEKLAEAARDLPALLKVLESIVAVDPGRLAAHLRRAELMLLAEEASRSREHIDTALELDPNSLKGRNLDVAWLIQTGAYAVASERALELVESEIADTISYVLAVTALAQQSELDQAVAVLDKGLAAYPEEAMLLLLRTRLAGLQGRFSEIPAAYEHLVALYPEEIAFWWELARFYIRDDQQDEAISVMRRALDANPQNEEAQYLLAELIANFRQGQVIDQIESLLEENEAVSVRFLLAKLYVDSADYAQAREQYEVISEQSDNRSAAMSARAELAQLALNQGQRSRAEELLAEASAIDALHPGTQLVQALLELQDGAARDAIKRVRAVLQDTVDNDQAHTLLGRAYLITGAIDLAEDALLSALKINALNVSAGRQLALLYRQQGKPERVIEVLSRFEAGQVGDPAIERELLRARLAVGEWAAARRLVDRGVLKQNNPTLKPIVEATILQSTGQPEAVVQLTKELLQEQPQSRDAAVLLIGAYNALGQSEDAMSFLADHAAAHPQYGWIEKLRFDTLMEAERYADAEALVTEKIAADGPQADYFGWLALVNLRQGAADRAVDALKQGIEQFPESAGLYEDLALLQQALSLPEDAAENFRRAVELDPQRLVAVNNLAVIYAQDPETLAEARSLAERLRGSADPNFSDTLGWICFKSGEMDCAITKLEYATGQAPASAEFHYHLGMVYRATNQESRGVATLKRAQELLEAGNQFAEADQLNSVLGQLDAS